MTCVSVFHRYVYRRYELLNAGTTYHFITRNLRDVFIFQSAAADPVMYIVDPNNDIVAYNDDYTGLASEIIYTPNTTAQCRLIIRAYTTKTPGYCDLYRGIDGAPPSLVESDVLFFGVRVNAQWNQGDVLETTNSTGDPYLYLITGNKLYTDDDSGPGLNSRFVTPTAGNGIAILGSYSRTTEGQCDLCLTPAQGPISLAPVLSPTPSPQERRYAVGSREMERFIANLKESKDALEELEPNRRDRRVVELQERVLSEEERRMQVAPMPQATPDFVRLQENYLQRYRELEPELETLSYDERSQRLAELKRQMVGP
jgi:hypothetical protein